MNRPLLFAVLTLSLFQSSCNQPPARSTIELKGGWEFRRVSKGPWRTATVPGCVHTDLLDRGLIPDPFYGDNERALQWIENEDWEYRTTFDLDADFLSRERIELDFEGLDTYADVFLNDSLVMRTDNMFREWKASCKGILRGKGNELRVYFHSPVEAVRAHWNALGRELPGGPRVLTRKAAYQYGWDWAPRYVTSGIWRPVRLVAWGGARIRDLRIVQGTVSAERADLSAVFETESTSRQSVIISIYVGSENFESFCVDLVPGLNTVPLDFSIPEPELWWTNGLGEPHLYDLLGEMRAGGTLLDWVALRFGVRTIELVREKDEAGTSFYFRLNGIPVFMKGANYVPPDSFLPRVGPDRYEYLVSSAADAGMNMLRVWGGGVYEDDAFYTMCDEYGILVWQDFMFACAMYPGDSTFLENVREEAIENVKRLRNHPSIALWCGNNEIDEGWHHWGWQRQYGYSAADSAKVWGNYVRLFHELLPAIVEDYDPGAPYWPSSPSYGRADTCSLTEGDSHDWGVWHDGEPFEAYAKKVPQFMSEFGFQSFPSLEAIERFTRRDERRIDSPMVLAHQKNERGNEIIRTYMERYYRPPRDFESFVYVSQLLQADGVKIGIEAHRRAKPYCMGSLFWQLDDCWPAVSWSSIDGYGNPKALYYYARRAFADVLVSPAIEGDTVRVFVVSDRQAPVVGPVVLRLLDFRGKVIWESRHQVRIRENSSTCVFKAGTAEMLQDNPASSVVLSAEVYEGGERLSGNLLYFVPPKGLELPPVQASSPGEPAPVAITAASEAVDGYSVTLCAGALVKGICLSVEGHEGYFDDNYFDMLPGDCVTVRFFTNERIKNFGDVITMRSLADTY